MNKEQQKNVIRFVCVIIAAYVSALNLNTFINAGGLFPGGFNGITVFIQRIGLKYFEVALPFTPINLALNAIPAYIGFKIIGKKFTLLSCLMIFLTGVFVDILPVYPVTEDILLIAVFGGIINGVALSIALRGRASSGGTDFIAMALSNKLNVSTWNYMLGLNALILLAAGYLFGWDKALYSIIFQFCSTQIINMLHTRYKRMTIFIVTSKADEIIPSVMKLTHHGVTRFEGEGGYSHKPRTMLYSVISRDEVKLVRKQVLAIDQSAFINVTKTAYVDGKFYQEPMD